MINTLCRLRELAPTSKREATQRGWRSIGTKMTSSTSTIDLESLKVIAGLIAVKPGRLEREPDTSYQPREAGDKKATFSTYSTSRKTGSSPGG